MSTLPVPPTTSPPRRFHKQPGGKNVVVDKSIDSNKGLMEELTSLPPIPFRDALLVISTFSQTTRVGILLIAINLRNRFKEANDTDAGNYKVSFYMVPPVPNLPNPYARHCEAPPLQ